MSTMLATAATWTVVSVFAAATTAQFVDVYVTPLRLVARATGQMSAAQAGQSPKFEAPAPSSGSDASLARTPAELAIEIWERLAREVATSE